MKLPLLDPTIENALREGAHIAFSVSGGKDGAAATLITNHYLDSIGHPKRNRILIHAHLGRIEWADSLPSCQRLAEFVDLPLITVQRSAGDMVDRWLSRWESSKRRYANMECVTLISPWSSASLRFCTSELKRDPITSHLKKNFEKTNIISVIGIRREESDNRAKALISGLDSYSTKNKTGLVGYYWHPVLDLRLADVFALHKEVGFPLHEAYNFGNQRVSCGFCILGSQNDITNAAMSNQLQEVYQELVQLEIDSAFSFQSTKWLGDAAPQRLLEGQADGITQAKKNHARRREIESEIPKSLRYEKGWPTRVPTFAEAELLARVRTEICKLAGIESCYLHGDTIINRYTDLMAQKLESAKEKKLELAPIGTQQEFALA